MAANAADKLARTANGGIPAVATVQTNRTAGVTTLSVDTQQYWPTLSGVKFSTYKVDTSGNKVAGSQSDWRGTSNGTNTLSNIAWAGGAIDTGNAVGDKVQMGPTAQWAEDLIEALLAAHNQLDGTLIPSAVVTAIAGQAIAPASLPNAFITPNMLKLLPQANTVATSQSTTSTSFADLTTTGPAVTVTIGANGFALVILSAEIVSATDAIGRVSFTASGANTIAAADANSVAVKVVSGAADLTASNIIALTSLTAGSTTFTCKYKTTSGTATFANRSITVIPL